MEQVGIHCNARNVWTKSRLPHVPGDRPRGNELMDVLQSEERRTPMLLIVISQAVAHRTLPHCTPLHRAAPQLSQLQMGSQHENIQGRFDMYSSYQAKSWRIVAKCPLRPMTSETMETLDFLCPLLHCPENGLRPALTQSRDIGWRHMARAPLRRRGQVFNNDIVKLIRANLLESGNKS